MINREEFNRMVLDADYDAVLSLFDESPGAVRRMLNRLTFEPGTPLQKAAIRTFMVLSHQRAAKQRLFFLETIRQHVWGMNEESSTIDWCGPEIIGAIIAGSPHLYREFLPIMFYNALHEPIFHNSLLAALEMIAAIDAELAAPYQAEFAPLFAPLKV